MRCYHCAEQVFEVSRWQVEFDGEMRSVCCNGCQAVMQAIIDSHLADYYRFRTEPAQFGVIPDDLNTKLNELKVFDEPEISERFVHSVPDENGERPLQELVEVNLSVEGLRCGACVWVLERSVAGLHGVSNARVNYSSARATVSFDPNLQKLSTILGRMAQVGYNSVPFDVRARELALKQQSKTFVQRLFVAGISTMQVMMYALPAYISDVGDIDVEHEQLLRWASFVLTVPVLVYSAQPFLKGAFNDIRNLQPGMDVPVSIGILAAFLASVWATITASGEIYFDSLAMFVFLLLGARYLEWSVRRRAMRAVDDISCSAPETAQRLVNGEVENVPALRLQAGDTVIVANGSRVPVDGRVSQGDSAVNNALITGESMPVVIGPGDAVAGGALITGAPIQLTVLRQQSASTLSVIDRLVDRGAAEKPSAVQFADRVATVFVTLLLVFAVIVWGVWMLIDPSRAATTAIAVLVVSCPCALSIATPSALAAATGELLKGRLLLTRGHALETLAKVTDVVFDKTGTLTTGLPIVASIDCADTVLEHVALDLAVALECGSTHPYAVAFRDEQARRGDSANAVTKGADADSVTALARLGYRVEQLTHEAGYGVSASLSDGSVLYLGSSSWCQVPASVLSLWHESDASEGVVNYAASEVVLSQRNSANDTKVLARFLLRDAARESVKGLVTDLQQRGMQVHLLSGDRLPAVRAVADELGLMNYAAAATPEKKQAYVADLQLSGKIVLMVGDGINDAPVLASADVSLAVGEATALARSAADVISLLPGLEGLPHLLAKARDTKRIVRQNLFWAVLYNTTAIPLAALGHVPPWAAAIGMALSSLLVAGNAQRLWSKQDQPQSVSTEFTTA